VTKELLEKEKADAVIIAAGAAPDKSIPGSDKKHVVSLFDVLEERQNSARTSSSLAVAVRHRNGSLYHRQRETDRYDDR
jgi:hypothetical protein